MRVDSLLAKLLIILLSAFGIMRGSEMVIRGENSMQNAAKLYIKLSEYVDIQSIGWLLLSSSLLLAISVFTEGTITFLLLTIGGLTTGTVHIFYGLVAVEGAKVVATYYTTLTLGIYEYIICAVGVMGLWKTNKNKD